MIDLAKFKNIEGNEKNRAEITQIGVLEAIDAYFEGDKLFSEEQIQKMVESNITKCEVYARLAKEETKETEEPTTPTPDPTDTPTVQDPDQEQQPEGGEGDEGNKDDEGGEDGIEVE